MKLLWIATLAVVAAGCTRTYFQGVKPQSQYALPNSNVTPLSKVRGESTSITLLPLLFGDPYISPDHKDEALAEALAKAPGANLLINYAVYEEEFRLPPLTFLFFKSQTYVVEGTAARMEVGTQELK